MPRWVGIILGKGGMAKVNQAHLIKVTFGSWYGFLAMGLGSGLSPKAPGTAGRAAALVLML